MNPSSSPLSKGEREPAQITVIWDFVEFKLINFPGGNSISNIYTLFFIWYFSNFFLHDFFPSSSSRSSSTFSPFQDYHVVLLYNPDERCVVYDMDSGKEETLDWFEMKLQTLITFYYFLLELPFPTHFHRYVSETFRTENILQPEYHRFFRIIPASRFLSLFSSDRSHMLRPDRSWIKPPPNYPPICSNAGTIHFSSELSLYNRALPFSPPFGSY